MIAYDMLVHATSSHLKYGDLVGQKFIKFVLEPSLPPCEAFLSLRPFDMFRL